MPAACSASASATMLAATGPRRARWPVWLRRSRCSAPGPTPAERSASVKIRAAKQIRYDDAIRQRHGRHQIGRSRVLNPGRKTERTHRVAGGGARERMARDDGVQPFRLDAVERRFEREEFERRGHTGQDAASGVEPVPLEVDQRERRLDGRVRAVDQPPCLLADGDGGKAGRSGERLLRADDRDVDAEPVDVQFVAAERRHGVEHDGSAARLRQARDLGQGVEDAAGGFGVDERDEVDAGRGVERRCKRLDGDRLGRLRGHVRAPSLRRASANRRTVCRRGW